MLYGAAYYPEHRPEACWAADCDLMQAAHVNTVRICEFAWSRFEPRCGTYDFAWLDRFLAIAHERGIRALLCPPLRTPPKWLVDQSPEVQAVQADDRQNHFGGRYRYCINQPALRRAGLRLAATMAERYGADERICGWHLDNELGWDDDCHCPVCRDRFRDWCRERYGTPEALNAAWGLAFWGLHVNGFEAIETPREGIGGIGPGPGINWRRFRSDCTVELVGLLAGAVRDHARQAITTNNQPLWNLRTDYFAMDVHLDQTGSNYYPNLSGDSRNIAMGLSAVRCYKGPGQTFQLHELRNAPHMIHGQGGGNRAQPGAIERIGMHVVANGADAIYFFRWDACPFGQEQNHGTIQGYDGKPRRIYGEVQRLGAALSRMSPLLAGTTVPSRVAILYDFASRWDVERQQGFSGDPQQYMNQAKRLHRVLRDQGYSVDCCGRQTDWSPYAVIVVPMLSCVDDALAERLLTFVREGGHLVWHPLCAMKDADGCIFPERVHPKLVELLGCRIQEHEPCGDGDLQFTWRGATWQGGVFADLPEGVAADAVCGRFTGDWFAETPALIERAFGVGRLHYCCCFADAAFYAVWLPTVCRAAGVERILPEAPPAAIELCERRHADGRRLLFCLNHGDDEQEIDLPAGTDLYHDQTVGGTTTIEARGVRVVLLS